MPSSPPDTPLQRFGATLRQYRKQRRLSQQDLAVRTGIRRAYISQIETGLRNISVLTLLRMTHALHIPAAWLLIQVHPHAPLALPSTDAPLPSRNPREAEAAHDAMGSPPPGDPVLLLARLGAAIRQARQQHHLSQQTLAARTGLSPTYIIEIEQGHRNLSVLSLVRIANALGLAVAELLAPLDTYQNASPLPPE
jgi:transcriptional regulator with XRE-family HTH domain